MEGKLNIRKIFDTTKYEYNLDLVKNIEISQYAGIVVAVAHDKFKRIGLSKRRESVVYDIKAVLNNSEGICVVY